MTVSIGKQIKKFRQKQEVSQQELADYFNIDGLCKLFVQNGFNQIGQFKFAVNIPVKRLIATFPLHDIMEINLQFGKYFRSVGGNFVSLINSVTKDQCYYFFCRIFKSGT